MSERMEIMERLAVSMERNFETQGPRIMRVLVEVLGGVRLTFPTKTGLDRVARNHRIRKESKVRSTRELGTCHRLCPSQIRRIVNSGNETDI